MESLVFTMAGLFFIGLGILIFLYTPKGKILEEM